MSHKSVFGAVAELIDNARDAGLPNSKKQSVLWIDEKRANYQHCLVFTDNGCGMNEEELHSMMSLGYTGRRDKNGTAAETECGTGNGEDYIESDNTENKDTENTKNGSRIGRFGFGFKSGSMRVGDDAIVLTMTDSTCSIGMYSTRFLQLIDATEMLLPIVSFDKTDMSHNSTDHAEQSLELIIKHSLIFASLADISAEFENLKKQLKGKTGTRIIIYSLKKTENTFELDFKHDAKDIVISKSKFDAPFSVPIEKDYRRSLREYCSILYSSSSMKIILRGNEVEEKDFQQILTNQSVTNHRNKPTGKSTKFVFGMTDQEDYGLMLYHNDRLIKAYDKLGCQTKNDEGKGVMALVDLTDIIEPMHNKQEFNTIGIHYFAYNAMIKAFSEPLNKYCRKNRKMEPPVTEQKSTKSSPGKGKRTASETPPSIPTKRIGLTGSMPDVPIPTTSRPLNNQTQEQTELLPAVIADENIRTTRSSTSRQTSNVGSSGVNGTACFKETNTPTSKQKSVKLTVEKNTTGNRDENESLRSRMSERNFPAISEVNVPDISEVTLSDISKTHDCSVNMNADTITIIDSDDDNHDNNDATTDTNDDDIPTLSSIKLEYTERSIKKELNSNEKHTCIHVSKIEHLNKELSKRAEELMKRTEELVKKTGELQNIRTNVLQLMSRTHSEFVKDVHASNLDDIDAAFEQKITEIADSCTQCS